MPFVIKMHAITRTRSPAKKAQCSPQVVEALVSILAEPLTFKISIAPFHNSSWSRWLAKPGTYSGQWVLEELEISKQA